MVGGNFDVLCACTVQRAFWTSCLMKIRRNVAVGDREAEVSDMSGASQLLDDKILMKNVDVDKQFETPE